MVWTFRLGGFGGSGVGHVTSVAPTVDRLTLVEPPPVLEGVIRLVQVQNPPYTPPPSHPCPLPEFCSAADAALVAM